MKKALWLVVIGMVLLAGISYAREVTTSNITSVADNDTISVPYGNTVYTKPFMIDDSEYNTISYYASSATGSVYLRFEFQEGWDNTNTSTFSVPSGVYDIVSGLTTEATWYHKGLSIPVMKYGRVKITGDAPNEADTLVQMKLHKMKYYSH